MLEMIATQEISARLRTEGILPPISAVYSKDVTDLIKKMVHISPEMRPTAQQILDSSPVKKSVPLPEGRSWVEVLGRPLEDFDKEFTHITRLTKGG